MEATNTGSELLQARPRLVPPSLNLPSKPQRKIRSQDVYFKVGSSWRAARSAAPRTEGLEQGEDGGEGGVGAT